jgi:hypothetical protein
MAFIMLASGRINWVLVLLCLYLLLPTQVYAGEFGANIINTNLIQEDGWYKLNADIDFNLSPLAEDALQHSISLVWNVHFELYQQRAYFWDKKVLDYSLTFRVRYHALLKMFQVKNVTNGEVRRFFSQASALKAMGEIRNLKIVQQDKILKPENSYAALKIQFDREALPLPLRPVSYFGSQWQLSSDWLQWPVQK